MKQRTMKTLGVAVLGAACAAASAGTASAVAPQSVEKTAGGMLKTLPVQEAARTLPAAQGKTGPAKSHRSGRDPVQQMLGGLPTSGGKSNPVDLPTGSLTSSLVPGGLPG